MSREKYADHLCNAVQYVRWATELADDAQVDVAARKQLGDAEALLMKLASQATARVARKQGCAD